MAAMVAPYYHNGAGNSGNKEAKKFFKEYYEILDPIYGLFVIERTTKPYKQMCSKVSA